MLLVMAFLVPTGAPTQGPNLLLWASLALALMMLGGFVSLEGNDLRSRIEALLVASALLSPLWNLGLFLARGGWLLHPFKLRQALNHHLSFSARLSFAFVATTAALPLGALAIPFWIYARHRIWPSIDETATRSLAPLPNSKVHGRALADR
jgi:hypothetical protein